MKKVFVGIALLLGVVAVALGLQIVASESGEVVVVKTRDAEGQTHETRLWIVDEGGSSWLRSGTGESGWLARVQTDPEIEITRGSETLRMKAIPEPERSARISELMRETYGWADAYISFMISRGGAVAIRLAPL